jgi:hypothetical protein
LFYNFQELPAFGGGGSGSPLCVLAVIVSSYYKFGSQCFKEFGEVLLFVVVFRWTVNSGNSQIIGNKFMLIDVA